MEVEVKNNWISIKDAQPKEMQKVLVIGHRETQLGIDEEPSIGYVEFQKIYYSRCVENADINYVLINMWMPVEMPIK